MIELPKFHETFIPILKTLENGETLHTRELYQLVIDKFYSKLSKEQLEEKTKSGDILIINRIAWGKSYLKKGGYIEFPKRGLVRITEKGIANINNSISLSEVENSSGFFEFYNEENNTSKKALQNIINSTPQDLIDQGFDQIEKQVKDELLEKLKSIDPFYFEKVILILLKKWGMVISLKLLKQEMEELTELLMKINSVWIRFISKQNDTVKIKYVRKRYETS